MKETDGLREALQYLASRVDARIETGNWPPDTPYWAIDDLARRIGSLEGIEPERVVHSVKAGLP